MTKLLSLIREEKNLTFDQIVNLIWDGKFDRELCYRYLPDVLYHVTLKKRWPNIVQSGYLGSPTYFDGECVGSYLGFSIECCLDAAQGGIDYGDRDFVILSVTKSSLDPQHVRMCFDDFEEEEDWKRYLKDGYIFYEKPISLSKIQVVK